MPTWKRRSVLATGAALSISGLASIGAGSEGDDAADLPDPDVTSNSGMVDEDWPSFAGDAGHARFIEDGYEFDGDLEVAWTTADSELASSIGSPSVAVADGTVYATGSTAYTVEQESFGVAAYDAADGSLRWKNGDINVSDPTVVGDTVYVAGEELFALDVSDGSVRWQTEFDPEDPIETQTVAYGAVFVVVDGTLYALEADDGSVQWEIESVTAESSNTGVEEKYEFVESAAAADGVVYAVTGQNHEGVSLALDPETGDEVWRTKGSGGGSQPLATTTAVALDQVEYYARNVLDAQTGGELARAYTEYAGLRLGNEIYLGGNSHKIQAGTLEGDEYSWEKSINYDIGQGVISGHTVYIYFPDDISGLAEYREELVALDKYDGTEKWTLSKDDAPVGEIRAISGETIYVDHDGDLVALREQTGDEEGDNQPDESNEDDGNDGTDGGDDEQDGSEDEDEQQDGEDDSDTGEDDSDDEDKGGSGGDDGGPVGGDDGDAGNGNAGNGDTGNETDAGNESETDTGNENETNAGDDTDDVPGFTTGAGLLGGAATLEWLRRKAGVDESTSVNEPPE